MWAADKMRYLTMLISGKVDGDDRVHPREKLKRDEFASKDVKGNSVWFLYHGDFYSIKLRKKRNNTNRKTSCE